MTWSEFCETADPLEHPAASAGTASSGTSTLRLFTRRTLALRRRPEVAGAASLAYIDVGELRVVSSPTLRTRRIWRPGEGVIDGMAQGGVDWSPEGGRLVLKTEKGVAVVRSTGGRVTWLTHNARDRSPRWSPDGQEVAFVRLPRCLDDFECKSPSNLYVMRRDGSSLQRLTEHSNAAEGTDDAGSPDFRAISDVAVIGADGRGLRMLAPNGRALRWSPDGKTILFSRPSNGLWAMDADGGRPTRLPLTGAEHALTVISADWGL